MPLKLLFVYKCLLIDQQTGQISAQGRVCKHSTVLFLPGLNIFCTHTFTFVERSHFPLCVDMFVCVCVWVLLSVLFSVYSE